MLLYILYESQRSEWDSRDRSDEAEQDEYFKKVSSAVRMSSTHPNGPAKPGGLQ